MTTLQALITKLSEAEFGTGDYDLSIHKFLGLCPAAARFGMYDECGRQHWSLGHTGGIVPEYTTSLDASLPGENITQSGLCEDGWRACHYSNDGVAYLAAAKTEILARRLACLKAMADG